MTNREIDALIAEHVMGLEPWPEQRFNERAFKAPIVPNGVEAKPCSCPEYSTDIAAAWKVVEKIKDLKGHDYYFAITWDSDAKWRADFVLHDYDNYPAGVSADTAPMAICLAALKAVDVK